MHIVWNTSHLAGRSLQLFKMDWTAVGATGKSSGPTMAIQANAEKEGMSNKTLSASLDVRIRRLKSKKNLVSMVYTIIQRIKPTLL